MLCDKCGLTISSKKDLVVGSSGWIRISLQPFHKKCFKLVNNELPRTLPIIKPESFKSEKILSTMVLLILVFFVVVLTYSLLFVVIPRLLKWEGLVNVSWVLIMYLCVYILFKGAIKNLKLIKEYKNLR